jgi:Flp pilus assembly protein TadB
LKGQSQLGSFTQTGNWHGHAQLQWHAAGSFAPRKKHRCLLCLQLLLLSLLLLLLLALWLLLSFINAIVIIAILIHYCYNHSLLLNKYIYSYHC